MIALVLALVGSNSVAQGLGQRVRTLGQWTVYRSVNSMTDQVTCVATANDGSVQVTVDTFSIGYRGRGGVSSYRYRLDDGPATELHLASGIERDIGAFIIRGDEFQNILKANRIRVEALTILRGLANDDIDLTGLHSIYPTLSTNTCAPAEPAPSEASSRSAVGNHRTRR